MSQYDVLLYEFFSQEINYRLQFFMFAQFILQGLKSEKNCVLLK